MTSDYDDRFLRKPQIQDFYILYPNKVQKKFKGTMSSKINEEKRNIILSNTLEVISEHGRPLPHQRYLMRYN